MSAPKQEQYYRVDIKRYPALAAEAEIALFVDYRKRRTALKREAIVRQYLYWAAELACRYCGPRMPKADAISAANFGLMQAIEKFDPDSGRRFVTYSYFAIRREVLYALRDSYVVNPESGIWASRYRFKISPQSPEDAAQHKQECREVFESVSSLFPTPGPGSDFQSRSIGCAEFDGLSPEEFSEDDRRGDVEKASLLEALQGALPSLPKELRTVIELKYFNGDRPLSFSDIGRKLKCSKDHARWLHSQAMKSLRKILRPVQKEL